MPEAPTPDSTDSAIYDMAQRVMSNYDSAGYLLRQRWVEPAGMWFTEIEPVGSGAATVSLYHGGDTLNVYFGSTWFEYFPFDVADLREIEPMVCALCEGDFEQAGTEDRSYARIFAPGRTWRVGHAHWPWPWKWRRKKRFPAYAS
ncbi:MAG: hypothetical protein ABIR57_11005 [Aeromicrobium sp.]